MTAYTTFHPHINMHASSINAAETHTYNISTSVAPADQKPGKTQLTSVFIYIHVLSGESAAVLYEKLSGPERQGGRHIMQLVNLISIKI